MHSKVCGARGWGAGGGTRRPPPPPHPIYVVTTPPADQHRHHLFGVHRPGPRDQYTSYVLGFQEARHAQTIAESLETYHRLHGRFPPRDLAVAALDLMSPGSGKTAGGGGEKLELRSVCVRAVELADLLQRLKGSGIVVTLMTCDPWEGSHTGFTSRDVPSDASTTAVVEALNSIWRRRGGNDNDTDTDKSQQPQYTTVRDLSIWTSSGDDADADDDDEWLPRLLPRPPWSPALAARRAAAVLPITHALAAAIIKCLVTAELMALLWLFD